MTRSTGIAECARNRRWAEEAWERVCRIRAAYPLSDDYGSGFQEGFADYLFQALEDRRFEPPQILRDKVARGELGKKTGRGFYRWDA